MDKRRYPPQFNRLIELYRFIAAICINLHMSSFEGLQRDDVWQDANMPPGGNGRILWQLAEDVGGLWSLLRGNSHTSRVAIDDNLKAIEEVLVKLASAYPKIIFIRGCFNRRCNVFHLDMNAEYPSIASLGDNPDLEIWQQVLSTAEYDYLLTCIAKNGTWKMQVQPLIEVFRIARSRIKDYL